MDGLLDTKPAHVCFEVEKIIGVSGDGNMRNYQVQWAPAWVSSFHLIGCEHLIQEFLQMQTEKETGEREVIALLERTDKESVTVALQNQTEKENRTVALQQHLRNNGTKHDASDFRPSIITPELHNTEQVVKAPQEGEWGNCRSIAGQAYDKLEDTVENSQRSCDSNISSNTYVVKVEEEDELIYGYSDDLIEPNLEVNISTVYVSPCSEPPDDSNSSLLGNSISNKAPQHQQNDTSIQSELSCETVNSSNLLQFSIPHDHFTDPHFVADHKETKRFNCTVCDKQFNHRSDLRIHHRKHTGVKPYHCPVCSKQFSDGSNMKRHMRIHSGVRPYTCSVCGKACSQKVHLQTHMRTHTSVQQYSCAVCGDLFPTSNHLRKHMLLHKEESCNM